MKCTLLFLLIAGMLAVSSCSSYHSYFGNGYHSLENSYLDKPFYDSIPQGAWYASARVVRATGYNRSFSSATEGDQNRVYEAIGYRGFSYRNISWAGGLFGYYGGYRLGNQHDSVLVAHYLSRKPYYGLGGKVSVNWNIPYAAVNFRPIGVAITLNREFGQYPTFVRQLRGQFPQVTTVSDRWGINVGLTTGLRARLSENTVLGYQVVFSIPDPDYSVVYRDAGTTEEEHREIFGGVSTAVFVGIKNALLRMQVGLGKAQLYWAWSLTYCFTDKPK